MPWIEIRKGGVREGGWVEGGCCCLKKKIRKGLGEAILEQVRV